VPVPSDQLVAWLAGRGQSGGFALQEKSLVVQPGYAYARVPARESAQADAGDAAIRYRAVRYDGVLTVTDSDRLLQTASGGIGSAKSFGFGLLSLAPLP
jgi:CRISPR system Cascade subunit CasE